MTAKGLSFGEDPDLMEAEILEAVPIGSPIAEAQAFMEGEGFACASVEAGTYSRNREDEAAPGGVRQEIFRNVDYLACDRQRVSALFVSRRWQAALEHEDGAVVRIAVSTGLIGP